MRHLLKRILVACALGAGAFASFISGICADFVWTCSTNWTWAQFRLARRAGIDLSQLTEKAERDRLPSGLLNQMIRRSLAFRKIPQSEIDAVFPRGEESDAQ